ncbi:hypothetical protein GWP57_09275 [Gammaproteobacteria bacterium]|jgi:hypothetical protein|nr:hypothetical protein [Gammaproteobacteria bacterium]
MSWARLLALLPLVLAIMACGGGPIDLTCDEVRMYQLAQAGKRIEVPDDLDGPSPLRELPLPEASPRPPRPEGSPCLDLPPSVTIGE